jgi:diguanylate cyclase (GGDEF)-like protein
MPEHTERELPRTSTGDLRDSTNQDEAVAMLQTRVRELEEKIRALRASHNASDALIEKLLEVRQRMRGELRDSRLQRIQLERLFQEEQQTAAKDDLTGVLKRKAFFKTVAKIREEIARGAKLAETSKKSCVLMLIDLDGLRDINNTHGHPAGDAALLALVNKIREKIRSTDVIGRFGEGADEFAIFFSGADLNDIHEKFAEGKGEKAKIEISVVFSGSAEPVTLTVSGGMVLLEPGDGLESAMKRADNALYKAKEGGRNQILEAVEEKSQ